MLLPSWIRKRFPYLDRAADRFSYWFGVPLLGAVWGAMTWIASAISDLAQHGWGAAVFAGLAMTGFLALVGCACLMAWRRLYPLPPPLPQHDPLLAEIRGIGRNLRALVEAAAKLSLAAAQTVRSAQEELKDEFDQLTQQWYKERGISSSTTDIVLCLSYQRIIGMGEKVLPLIVARLREEGNKPDQWFWALRSIAGENPVPQEYWGRRREMARIWLEWAEKHGY